MITTTQTTWTERLAAILAGESADAFLTVIEAARLARLIDDTIPASLWDDAVLEIAVHVDLNGADSEPMVRWFVTQLGWAADFATGLASLR